MLRGAAQGLRSELQGADSRGRPRPRATHPPGDKGPLESGSRGNRGGLRTPRRRRPGSLQDGEGPPPRVSELLSSVCSKPRIAARRSPEPPPPAQPLGVQPVPVPLRQAPWGSPRAGRWRNPRAAAPQEGWQRIEPGPRDRTTDCISTHHLGQRQERERKGDCGKYVRDLGDRENWRLRGISDLKPQDSFRQQLRSGRGLQLEARL